MLRAFGVGNEPVQQFQKTVFVIGFPRHGPGKAVILQQRAPIEGDALPPALRVIPGGGASVSQGRTVRLPTAAVPAACLTDGKRIASSRNIP